MYSPGHVAFEFSAEEAEAMRDSVYGYNDELAYAILGQENAGDYVLRHISPENYNFSVALYGYLYKNRFQHEFFHLLLGLSFLIRGYNPLPFEYGYDGNYMAEKMVLTAEEHFFTKIANSNKNKYIEEVIYKYTDGRYSDISNIVEAINWVERDKSLTRVFDARRKLKFDDCETIRRNEIMSLIQSYQSTNYEDMLYTGQDIPRDVIEQYFDDIQPIVRLVERNFRRLIDDDNLDIEHSHEALRDYLKIIPVSILWDVMDEPELAETIDLDHQKHMTWEFALLHDQNMKQFTDCLELSSDHVRNILNDCKPMALDSPYNECELIGNKFRKLIELKDEIVQKKRRQLIPFGEKNTGANTWKVWKYEFKTKVLSALLTRGVDNLPANMLLASSQPTSLKKKPSLQTQLSKQTYLTIFTL